MKPSSSETFSRHLLKWYKQHGRHDLPWQLNPTPYRVWVSEIMLQQTQVATVIPYYLHFMKTFPTITSLAFAQENDVLALWSGLGYYARARNLHRTAKIIVSDLKGEFPATVEAMAQLPGIGLSTAGAIISFSQKKRAVILDGNVRRVLTRFFAIDEPVDAKSVVEKLWMLADQLTPKKDAHYYNQAIMDLGATLCTRTKPQCAICPQAKACQAFQKNNVTFYPVKQAKKEKPIKTIQMKIIFDRQSRVLLMRRPSTGIWGGLWTFPEDEIMERELTHQKTLPEFTHQFTHFTLRITPVYYRFKKSARVLASREQIWYNVSETLPGGVPAPVQRILEMVRNGAYCAV